MNRCVVAIAVALLAVPAVPADARPKKFKGEKVRLSFHDPPLVDLLRLLADIGRTNIVVVDGTPAALGAVRYRDVPWDRVLDELVPRAKLAYFKLTANTIVVGTPELVAAQKSVKRKYKGKKVDLDVKDADAATAATLLAVAGGKPFAFDGAAPRRATLRLKKVPADLAGDVVAMQTGATISTGSTTVEKVAEAGVCVATQSGLADLTLRGIATAGKARYAILTDGGGTGYVVTSGSCIGMAAATVKDLGTVSVTFSVGAEEVSMELHPLPPDPGPPDP